MSKDVPDNSSIRVFPPNPHCVECIGYGVDDRLSKDEEIAMRVKLKFHAANPTHFLRVFTYSNAYHASDMIFLLGGNQIVPVSY
jgi:hypothetical protein